MNVSRSPSHVETLAEHRLLTLLTLVQPDEHERSQIVETIAQVRDWELWFETAAFNKVVPMCCHSLHQLELCHVLPPHIRSKVEGEADAIAVANGLRNKEAEVFLTEFRNQGIRVALLKGVAFGEIVYVNPAYKRMNDIDLLIEKENLDAIYAIYGRCGYFYFGERISGSKAKSDRMTHLSPPYINKECTCVIGTQWGIKTPLGPFQINYQSLWRRARPARFMGVDLEVLSPEDNLHHLSLHLGFFKISVRDLMDIYNLLRVFRDNFDWNQFYEIVEESGSHDPAYFALALSQYLYPLPDVEIFLLRIESKTSSRIRKAVRWKTRSMEVFLSQHSDHIQTIEKALAVFDSTSYFPEKGILFFKLWNNILWPPEVELIRLNALYQPTMFQLFTARITTPYRILDVIAQEVGWRLVILLQVKMAAMLGLSFIQFPFVSRQRSDMNAYARKLGLSLPKLVELKDQFQ